MLRSPRSVPEDLLRRRVTLRFLTQLPRELGWPCHLLPQEGSAECARSGPDPREHRPSTPLQCLHEVICGGTLDC
jgi:hypothetical protein